MSTATLFREYFDPHYYFDLYRDEIYRTQLDPFTHFLSHGLKKGFSFSPLFWDGWYVAANPDLANQRLPPAKHYLRAGWKQGRKPSPLFDTVWYLARNPDVGRAGMEPLLHYLIQGWREGRAPHPLFDTRWYLEQNPDVRSAGLNPLSHFVRSGWREGRAPHPLFDTGWYLEQYPDVRAAGINPLAHFLEHGWKEGRSPHPLFDIGWYLTRNRDSGAASVDPLSHFIEVGWKEGRAPHPLFATVWYLDQNPDVKAAGVNPLAHFLISGWREGRAPHPQFDIAWYLEQNPDVRDAGINPLVHFLVFGWREGRSPNRHFSVAAYLDAHPDSSQRKVGALIDSLLSAPARDISGERSGSRSVVEAMIDSQVHGVRPLRILNVRNDARRLTIVTDTLDEGSFFGGVATSLILATKLALASERTLRVVTRCSYPHVENYWRLLERCGLSRPRAVELYSDFDYLKANCFKLDVSPSDVFLTTSWWSTHSLRRAGFAGKAFYVLQECETMFYPHGDEQLLARKTLADDDLYFIVNSRMLYEYLGEMEGYRHIRSAGTFFEPAFPPSCYSPSEAAFVTKDRHRVLFYARPQNPRNLFLTGLGVLDGMICKGVLDTNRVEICFAGAPLEPFQFTNGYRPVLLGKMPWTQYLDFLKSVDLGFSLMYTPHPSYPPLDVAATGGVALTNQFATKTSLSSYSRNILCFDLMSPQGAEQAFASALDLMMDATQRRERFVESPLCRDWDASLADSIGFFLDRT